VTAGARDTELISSPPVRDWSPPQPFTNRALRILPHPRVPEFQVHPVLRLSGVSCASLFERRSRELPLGKLRALSPSALTGTGRRNSSSARAKRSTPSAPKETKLL
jgi:hypothetical protein